MNIKNWWMWILWMFNLVCSSDASPVVKTRLWRPVYLIDRTTRVNSWVSQKDPMVVPTNICKTNTYPQNLHTSHLQTYIMCIEYTNVRSVIRCMVHIQNWSSESTLCHFGRAQEPGWLGRACVSGVAPEGDRAEQGTGGAFCIPKCAGSHRNDHWSWFEWQGERQVATDSIEVYPVCQDEKDPKIRT